MSVVFKEWKVKAVSYFVQVKVNSKKDDDSAASQNGFKNGHANGHANGYANGHANGKVFSSDEAYLKPELSMESSYTTQDTLRTRAFVNREQTSTSS